MTELRPNSCRFRLRDEGKAYPRSSCLACGKTITTGLGTSCSHAIDEVDKIVETLASTTADGIERAADLAERLLMAKPDISVLDVIALQRAAAGEIRKPSVQ